MNATEAPFPQFFEKNGTPLNNGSLYFGVVNQNPETAPIPIYWDAAGTQPAAQPVPTLNGYAVRAGTPAFVFANTDYSLTVRNSKGEIVYYVPNSAEWSLATQIDTLRTDLANTSDLALGDALVGVKQPFTGTVADTQHRKNSEELSVLDFFTAAQRADVLARTALIDVTANFQAAITEAYKTGKICKVPAGLYLISASLNIPPDGGYEYRADAFQMVGEGAGAVFLGYTLTHGTTIICSANVPLLKYTRRLGEASSNNIYLRHIRFEQTGSGTSAPVLQFEAFAGYSELANLEIRNAGIGDGIDFDRVYQATIAHCNIVNRDLVNFGSGVSRVGNGINAASLQSGGLLTIHKCTTRGFLTGYRIGDGTNSLYSAKLEQCECSVMTNGIVIDTAIRNAVIDTCYFEAVYFKPIIDKGTATQIFGCFIFEGFTIGIDSNYLTHGNTYRGNTIQLNSSDSIGIEIYAEAGASGYQKNITDNHIYFLGSGGSLTNVNGIRYVGTAPALSIMNNDFRPRREWVGGAGTQKINATSSTGKVTGIVPITDTLNEFELASNYAISFPPAPSALTQANVSANVLTIPASAADITITASGAASVTSISGTGQMSRMLTFDFSNTNMTFTKGASMELASNFSGPGTLFGKLTVTAGVAVFREYSRTVI